MNEEIFAAACRVVWVLLSSTFNSLMQPNKNDKVYLYSEAPGEKK